MCASVGNVVKQPIITTAINHTFALNTRSHMLYNLPKALTPYRLFLGWLLHRSVAFPSEMYKTSPLRSYSLFHPFAGTSSKRPKRCGLSKRCFKDILVCKGHTAWRRCSNKTMSTRASFSPLLVFLLHKQWDSSELETALWAMSN